MREKTTSQGIRHMVLFSYFLFSYNLKITMREINSTIRVKKIYPPGMPDLECHLYHFGDRDLMQFTGFPDKNGVEIYEGDILLDVEFDENNNNISGKFPVVYDSNKCQFAIDNSFKKDGR